MCWPRMFRGRNFKWLKRYGIFITIAFVVTQWIQVLPSLCKNPSYGYAGFCVFQGDLKSTMVLIGWCVFSCLAFLVYELYLKRILIRRFPMSCGHKKRIFTGKSSKTLSELLLKIDKELPTEEVYEDEKHTVLRFLEDIRKTLQTNITPESPWEPILAGSVIEKYGIPFSFKKAKIAGYVSALKTDIDAMLCFDHEGMDASISDLEGNILIHVLSPFLGFAQLTYKAGGDVISSKDIMKQVKHAVSCTKITNFPRHKYCFGKCVTFDKFNYKVKGPAINVSMPPIVDCDITPCIKCREWPPHSDWPTRPRCWPSQEDVTRIVSHGCHLVAKPAPSDKEETSWRFSFSVAEVELSKLVPNTARKCLLALKIILKDHLQPVVAEITSYDLKTIFLNTLEKTEVDFWVDENIEECFLLLMKEFHDALVCGNCPHHWFESVNLFTQLKERHPKQIAALIRKIKMVVENPAPFIFDDGCCCLYPCCTRKRLYDFQGTRLSNLDRSDDEMPIYVNEQVGNSNDALEPASHAVSVESIREHDPGHPSTSLESVDHKKGTSEEAVIIEVQPDDAGDEVPMRVELGNEQVGNSNNAFEPASHAVSVDSIREHDPGHPSTSLESGC